MRRNVTVCEQIAVAVLKITLIYIIERNIPARILEIGNGYSVRSRDHKSAVHYQIQRVAVRVRHYVVDVYIRNAVHYSAVVCARLKLRRRRIVHYRRGIYNLYLDAHGDRRIAVYGIARTVSDGERDYTGLNGTSDSLKEQEVERVIFPVDIYGIALHKIDIPVERGRTDVKARARGIIRKRIGGCARRIGTARKEQPVVIDVARSRGRGKRLAVGQSAYRCRAVDSREHVFDIRFVLIGTVIRGRGSAEQRRDYLRAARAAYRKRTARERAVHAVERERSKHVVAAFLRHIIVGYDVVRRNEKSRVERNSVLERRSAAVFVSAVRILVQRIRSNFIGGICRKHAVFDAYRDMRSHRRAARILYVYRRLEISVERAVFELDLKSAELVISAYIAVF